MHLPILRFICESQGFSGWVFKGHSSPWTGCCTNHILMLTGSTKKLGFGCVRRCWNCCLTLLGMAPTKSAKLDSTEIPCINGNGTITSSSPSVHTPFPATDLQSWGPVNLSSPQPENCSVSPWDEPHMGAHLVLLHRKGQEPPLKASSFLLLSSTHVGVASKAHLLLKGAEQRGGNKHWQSAFDLILYWVF